MNIRTLVRAIVVSAALGIPAFDACADDWPQWRGPNRDGISKETGLLKVWPEAGPKLLWTSTDVGGGYSTPAVVGDRVYVMGDDGPDNEFVLALNVADGKPAWKQRVGKVGPNVPAMNYPGSRSTPTVVGDVLYALGSDGDLVCLNRADGTPRWQKNLRTEFGGKPGEWAYSESVLVDGENVVCTPGGEKATLVALNREDGKTIWTSAIPGGDEAAYSSIIAAEIGGVRQYVQFLQKGLVGIDAKTGAFHWRYDATAKNSPANIPTPVAHGPFIYSATHRGGSGLIEVTKGGDGEFAAKQVYFGNKLPAAIGGAVLVDGHLYGAGGQVLICIDFKTGDVKWTDRSVGAGSVLYADGRLYLHGENGDVALAEASPQDYKEHGRFTPEGAPDRGRSKAWAYPVVANGRLYVRDMGVLWCYDVKDSNRAN